MIKPVVYNLDTCIIIEILRSNPIVINNMLKAVGNENKIAICSVAYYEVIRGYDNDKNRKKLDVFKSLCNDAERFELKDKAIDIAANIYRYLCERCAILITDNVKHFARVPDLKVINWKDLGD